MNNDLISRSELIKAINTYDTFACLPDGKLYPVRDLEHPEMFETYIHVKDVIRANDNAPTVEQNWRFYYDHGYAQAKRDFEKPQGEWVLMYCSYGYRYYSCSICNRAIEVEHGQSLKDFPYCHCGAKMKGGAE